MGRVHCVWFVLLGDNQHHLVVVVMVTTPISHIESESATIAWPTDVLEVHCIGGSKRGARDARLFPFDSNSFIFAQFSGEIRPNNRLLHSLWGWRPLSGNSWIHH